MDVQVGRMYPSSSEKRFHVPSGKLLKLTRLTEIFYNLSLHKSINSSSDVVLFLI